MWQCAKCGMEVDDSLKWCWICGTSPDGTEYPSYPLAGGSRTHPGGLVKAISSWLNWMPKATGVPRRFSLGRLMLITAFYAVLFSLLSCLDAHPIVFAMVAVFFTGIGLGQVFLFKGKRPRKASIVAGSILSALMWSGMFVVATWGELANFGPFDILLWLLVIAIITIFAAPVGGFFGYAAGCLIAGIFLGKRPNPAEAKNHRFEIPDPLSPDHPQIATSEDSPEG